MPQPPISSSLCTTASCNLLLTASSLAWVLEGPPRWEAHCLCCNPCRLMCGVPPLGMPSQSFCATTKCSGHGACDEAGQLCLCNPGYSGLVCQRTNGTNTTNGACQGPTDVKGTCCGASGILTRRGLCCSSVPLADVDDNGTAITAPSRPRLNATGGCCASGRINACGVCDGPRAAVLSATGTCCEGGVVDAGGLCCPSGLLDAFGVCDGTDATGTQVVTVHVAPGPGVAVSVADLGNWTSPSRAALVAAIVQDVATKLGRDASYVRACVKGEGERGGGVEGGPGEGGRGGRGLGLGKGAGES
jgi:hypothetical protein